MRLSKFIPEHLIDDSIYVPMDILESCYTAIDEGVIDPSIVDIARNNSDSMVISYLDRSLYLLEKYTESLNSYLNNFILNYAKLAEKYKSVIIQMYEKSNTPITYHTYQYPKQRDKFPRELNIKLDWYRLVSEARGYADVDISQLSKDEYLNVQVDKALQEFTQSYLGKKLNVKSLENETRKHTQDTLRGVSKTIGLTPKNINDIINNIVDDAKSAIKELKTTKAQYQKDYKSLQSVFDVRKPNKKISFTHAISMMKKPEMYAFEREELRRFSTVNLEINRMLTGLVTVYSTAFSTKLTIIKEKIDVDRELLVKLLEVAGTFAAINNKTATKQSQPLKKVEEIDKFRL